MRKNKAIIFGSVALLSVGAATGAILLTKGNEPLESKVNASDEVFINYVKGQDTLTNGNLPFQVSNEGETFVNLDPVQKISQVKDIAPIEEDATYQAGYYIEDKVYYTDPLKLVSPLTFEAGKQPAFIKINNQVTTALKIGYHCVTGGQHDIFPEVEKGLYIVGKGTFLNANHPVEWNTKGGVKMTETSTGKYTYTGTFTAGDEIRFKSNDPTWQNDGWYTATNHTANKGYVTKTGDNYKFEKTGEVTIELDNGRLYLYDGIKKDIYFYDTGAKEVKAYAYWNDGVKQGEAGLEFGAYPGIVMEKVRGDGLFKITIRSLVENIIITPSDNKDWKYFEGAINFAELNETNNCLLTGSQRGAIPELQD